MEIMLHEREMDLMEVLWERGSATAAEVRDALVSERRLSQTQIQQLRRLLADQLPEEDR